MDIKQERENIQKQMDLKERGFQIVEKERKNQDKHISLLSIHLNATKKQVMKKVDNFREKKV
jgi:hypothetical protein